MSECKLCKAATGKWYRAFCERCIHEASKEAKEKIKFIEELKKRFVPRSHITPKVFNPHPGEPNP